MATMNRAGIPINRTRTGKGHRTKRAALKAAARQHAHKQRAFRAGQVVRDDER